MKLSLCMVHIYKFTPVSTIQGREGGTRPFPLDEILNQKKITPWGVTEVRSKILTPLETTGGNSLSLEGFEKMLFKIQSFMLGYLHSIGGIQISFQRVYNSTGEIQKSLQGVYNSTGGIQISFQGVYNSTGGIQKSLQGLIIPLEGFRNLSRGLIIPLEGFRYPS